MDFANTALTTATVEYHDPSGIFPLVANDITSRVPLRNLNWQSPSRPLRQIKSLHADFVPDGLTKSSLLPPEQRVDSNKPNSLDIVRSGRDHRKDAAKERRHQIPGLKTSPYLKIYLLRCDDKDAYKEAERKRVREWIREIAQPEGRHANHDAFEWMILHVVIPDTIAASEPRWRESSKDPDELKERNKSGKIIGKSTRTVFDRLRADFNESGKTKQDRIAQIRIPKANFSRDLLPTPAVAETIEETADEREKTWNDLMSKFKSLILGSFDLRVRQYEADIAAQEARRSLPGWNFCTFFIHKEGLAKALESIGLVEDALAIYDELALGLETVIRDLASGQAEGTATTFAVYTSDLENRITAPERYPVNGNAAEAPKQEHTLDLFNKDYREQILRSNISIFDFFCYIFQRQKALILRLANTKASQAVLGTSSKDGGEDLVLISEVSWRAASFIHNNARVLRQDLASRPDNLSPRSQSDAESLLRSWTYAVAAQVLAETHAPALDQVSAERRLDQPNGEPRRPDFGFGLGANPYPQRSSSLLLRKPAQEQQRPHSSAAGIISSPPGSPDVAVKSAAIPGLPELATYRAELVMLQRKTLEHFAEIRGWCAGWASVKSPTITKMQSISLSEGSASSADTEPPVQEDTSYVSALQTPAVASALTSEAMFQNTYEDLSNQAMRLYLLATQAKSIEAIAADLAMLKVQQEDFEIAATYFESLLPIYATDGWSLMEVQMLSAYAACLKKLDRKDAYVKTSLDLLAKVCGKRMVRGRPSVQVAAPEDDGVDTSDFFAELVVYSEVLLADLTSNLRLFFSEVSLEHELIHEPDSDGFALRLRFNHVLEERVKFDRIRARLTSVDDPAQDIWLSSISNVHVTPGLNQLDLQSSCVTLGAYHVDKIVFQANKLRFVHELHPQSTQTPLGIVVTTPLSVSESSRRAPSDACNRPFVFLYPSERAFNAEVSLPRTVHISKPRHLEVQISSGWNDITSIEMKFKPTSAGLRLHVADASADAVERRQLDETRPGTLLLGAVALETTAIVKVPYTIEQASLEIAVRLEVTYHTSKGTFTHISIFRHPTELALDVDVNDIFHPDKLLSNFTVRTISGKPLRVTSAKLVDSAVYAVESPPTAYLPANVFEAQPIDLIYKITRKSKQDARPTEKEAALALSVDFYTMHELVTTMFQACFAEDFGRSNLKPLSRLLLPLLSERCRNAFSKAELAAAVFLGELKMPTFSDLGWHDVVATLPRTMQKEIAEWLLQWHKDHQHLRLEERVASQISRRVTIPVDIPTIDVVHKLSLSVDGTIHYSAPDVPIIRLGQSVDATLRIAHTRSWSSGRIFGKGDPKDDSLDFVYEVQADPETWLVGGHRRARFTAAEDEEVEFHLLLVPLKLGEHALPHVDIQPAPAMDNVGDAAGKALPLSCEATVETAGREVRVILDGRSSRVHVSETAPIPASAIALPLSRPGTAISKEPG